MKQQNQETDIYRVERLLEKRTRGSRVEYLVKWKNWSEAHNTWEPEKNILDKRLIENFIRRQQGLPVPSDSSDTNEVPSSPESKGEEKITEDEVGITDPSPLEDNFPANEDLPSPAMTEPCVSSTHQSRESFTTKREFRKTTQLVTAATQSAIYQNRQRQFYQNIGSSNLSSPATETCAKSLPALSPPTLQSPEVHEPEQREKIKLIIPRERLKACPPPDVPSAESSVVNSSQSFIESAVEDLPSIEKARKSLDSVSSIRIECPELEIAEFSVKKKSPSKTLASGYKRRLTGSKVVKKKRKRHVSFTDDSSDESDKSVYFGETSEILEQEPKLAPLRIQLPKSGLVNSQQNRANYRISNWLDKFKTVNLSDLKVLKDMTITDITVNNLTITIKEIDSENAFMKEIPRQTVISPQTAMETNSDKENYHSKGVKEPTASFIAKVKPINEIKSREFQDKKVPIVGKAYLKPDDEKKVEKLVIKMDSSKSVTPESKTMIPVQTPTCSSEEKSRRSAQKLASPPRHLPSMVPFPKTPVIDKSKPSFLTPMKKISKTSDKIFSNSRKRKSPATICYKPQASPTSSKSANACSVYAFPDDPKKPMSPPKRINVSPDSNLRERVSPVRENLVSNSLKYAEFISRMNAVVNSFPFVDPTNFLGFNLPKKESAKEPQAKNYPYEESYDSPIDLSAKR